MLAPCMTVLSTSKNAAAVGVGRGVERVSTSADAAAASPASGRTLLQVEPSRSLFPGSPVSHDASVDGSAHAGVQRRLCRLAVTEAAAWTSRPSAGSRPRRERRTSLTWAQLEDEVARVADRARCAGRRAGQRVDDRRRQPDRVRDRLPRGAPRPGRRRSGQPAVGHRRAGADGRRQRRPADGRRRHGDRRVTPRPGPPELGPDVLAGRRPCLVAGTAPGEGEVGFADLRADLGRPVPPLPDPESWPSCSTPAVRRACRGRRCSATGRCWPTSSRSAAVEPPMITATTSSRRAAALPRLRPQRRAGRVLRHRAQLVLVDGFDPGLLDLIDDEACSVVPVAPPVFAHWRPTSTCASGSARSGWCCRARRR